MYVVGEVGIGVKRRVRAWEKTHNDCKKLETIRLINCPVFPVLQNDFNEVILAARQVEEETGKPVRFIVIDTLARCFGGNDAHDMGAFIKGCDTIKQRTGATLLVVHHSGKDDSKGARGSSAFRASLDAE